MGGLSEEEGKKWKKTEMTVGRSEESGDEIFGGAERKFEVCNQWRKCFEANEA